MAIARPLRPSAAAVEDLADPVTRWRGGLAFLMPSMAVLPLLFVPQLGGAGVLLFLAATGLALVPPGATPLHRLLRGWPVLTVAGFAILSTLWSTAPPTTLRYGLQLAITVLVGMVIGGSEHPRRTLWGVFAAFGFYAVVSIAFGGSSAWGAGQDTAFTGLNGGKNYLADIVAIGFIAGLACLLMALRRRRWLLATVTVAILLVEVITLGLARSSGAILGVVLAAGAMAGMLVLTRSAGGPRAMLIAALLILSSVGIAAAAIEGPAIRAELLQVMGKDDTLTGRVYLWYRADTIMQQHPLLGTGYGAFWVQGQLDAEGLWAYSGILNRLGFNFHNTQTEQRVGLGWIGYLLIAGITLGCTVLLIGRFFASPSMPGVFWSVLMIYELSRVGYEAIGPTPFNMGTVMMAAALAFATASGDRGAIAEERGG